MLEVSLRNAGYNVAGCPSVGKAFEILHANKPDLILVGYRLRRHGAGSNSSSSCGRTRDWADIPFMFLSSDGSIESKIRGPGARRPGLSHQADLHPGGRLRGSASSWPGRHALGLALKSTDARTRFSGSLSEMSVVDLLQTIDVSRKSGVLTLLAADGQEGMISFDSGAVINAMVEDLRGEDAIYRQLLWREGQLRPRVSSCEPQRANRPSHDAGASHGGHAPSSTSGVGSRSFCRRLTPCSSSTSEMLRERLREMPVEQNEMVQPDRR